MSGSSGSKSGDKPKGTPPGQAAPGKPDTHNPNHEGHHSDEGQSRFREWIENIGWTATGGTFAGLLLWIWDRFKGSVPGILTSALAHQAKAWKEKESENAKYAAYNFTAILSSGAYPKYSLWLALPTVHTELRGGRRITTHISSEEKRHSEILAFEMHTNDDNPLYGIHHTASQMRALEDRLKSAEDHDTVKFILYELGLLEFEYTKWQTETRVRIGNWFLFRTGRDHAELDRMLLVQLSAVQGPSARVQEILIDAITGAREGIEGFGARRLPLTTKVPLVSWFAKLHTRKR